MSKQTLSVAGQKVVLYCLDDTEFEKGHILYRPLRCDSQGRLKVVEA